LVGLFATRGNLHSRRAGRHARHGETDRLGPLGQQAAHVLRRHVADRDVAAHLGDVAGRQRVRDAPLAPQGRNVLDVDHGRREPRPGHRRHPAPAAAAGGGLVDGDLRARSRAGGRTGGNGGGRSPRSQEEASVHGRLYDPGRLPYPAPSPPNRSAIRRASESRTSRYAASRTSREPSVSVGSKVGQYSISAARPRVSSTARCCASGVSETIRSNESSSSSSKVLGLWPETSRPISAITSRVKGSGPSESSPAS